MTGDLQPVIYAALDAALTQQVYDYVPQGAAFPYVRIGNDTLVPFDTDEDFGDDITVMIHVYSQYRGSKEVQSIQKLIYNALNRSTLTVTGFHVLGVDQIYCDIIEEGDGLTRHGLQRFRVLMEKT
jgi:hypothetical protein